MLKFRFHHLLFFLLFISLLSLIEPTAITKAQTDPVVRVVTKEIPPFVIKEDDRLTGFSIDLWKEIALRANLPFEFIEVTAVKEQLDALTNGDAEVAIAAISMTPEREVTIDFSYPYYQAGLQILTKEESRNILSSLFAVLLSPHLLLIMAVLFLLLIIIGHLVWWLERKNNPDFPQSYLPGVWEGRRGLVVDVPRRDAVRREDLVTLLRRPFRNRSTGRPGCEPILKTPKIDSPARHD
jgi:hypothetical protein